MPAHEGGGELPAGGVLGARLGRALGGRAIAAGAGSFDQDHGRGRNLQRGGLVGELLRAALPGVFVTLSSDLLPQLREYERTSNTVINAYVGPPVRR